MVQIWVKHVRLECHIFPEFNASGPEETNQRQSETYLQNPLSCKEAPLVDVGTVGKWTLNCFQIVSVDGVKNRPVSPRPRTSEAHIFL